MLGVTVPCKERGIGVEVLAVDMGKGLAVVLQAVREKNTRINSSLFIPGLCINCACPIRCSSVV